jgi:hypothetical protein
MDVSTQAPLLIGLSARIYTPGSAGVALPGVWTKQLHYLEQSAAHWVMSGGALAVMVPALHAGSTARRAGGPGRLRASAGRPGAARRQRRRASTTAKSRCTRTGWATALRDAYEMAPIRAFVQAGKPVFGICRGLQLLNVCFGGTLLQDITTQLPEALDHRQPGRYEDHFHSVEFVPGTHLASPVPGAVPGHHQQHPPPGHQGSGARLRGGSALPRRRPHRSRAPQRARLRRRCAMAPRVPPARRPHDAGRRPHPAGLPAGRAHPPILARGPSFLVESRGAPVSFVGGWLVTMGRCLALAPR